jgi:hypothetical protein
VKPISQRCEQAERGTIVIVFEVREKIPVYCPVERIEFTGLGKLTSITDGHDEVWVVTNRIDSVDRDIQ